MGVLWAAIGLACSFAVAFGLVPFWLGRRFRDVRLVADILVVAGMIVSAAYIPLFAGWISNASTTTLINIDPREGERSLLDLGLPPGTTSEVCLRYLAVGPSPLADFSMAERDFLAWMNAKQWTIASFESDHGIPLIVSEDGKGLPVDTTVYPVRGYGQDAERIVQRGYRYFWRKPRNPDNTITIIYDIDEERVYYMRTTY